MVSNQNVRAPFPFAVAPLLGTALPDREARQRTWLEGTYSSAGDEPPGSTEVVVKNTFIHVADVAQPLMRSRSASDLGSSASSVESDIRLVNSASIAPSSVSSASQHRASIAPGMGTPSTVPWPSSVGVAPTDAENEFFSVDEIQEQDETGEWSNGSANHDAGGCSPCFYHRSKSGCRSGRSCRFCHLPHVRKPRVRPSKAKRDQCKQIVKMLGTTIPENPGPMVDTLCSTRKEKAYLLTILKGKARAQHEERWEQLEVDPSGGSSNQNDVRHQAAGLWKMSL